MQFFKRERYVFSCAGGEAASTRKKEVCRVTTSHQINLFKRALNFSDRLSSQHVDVFGWRVGSFAATRHPKRGCWRDEVTPKLLFRQILRIFVYEGFRLRYKETLYAFRVCTIGAARLPRRLGSPTKAPSKLKSLYHGWACSRMRGIGASAGRALQGCRHGNEQEVVGSHPAFFIQNKNGFVVCKIYDIGFSIVYCWKVFLV